MSMKDYIATLMLQKAQQKKDDEDQEQNGTAPVTTVQTDDPYVRWSTYVQNNLGVDNAATAKFRQFMAPSNQVQRANDFFSTARNNSNPYTHPENKGVYNPYAKGTMLYDVFEAVRGSKELPFSAKSAIDQVSNMTAYEKMGINDPYLAIAGRNDVANQLNEAIVRGQDAAPVQYDRYVDRNAGKGYTAFGGQAGDVHKYGLEYENVLAAMATKQNRKDGLMDSEDTLRAGDYASLSDKYIDDMISKISNYVSGLDDKIDSGSLYDQEYFQRMSLNALRGEAYSANDLYEYARTMFPGENWSTGDFGANGDPDKIAKITAAVESDIADMRAGKGGKVLNAYDAVKGERMTAQSMLDDLRKEKINRATISDLEKRYALENGSADYTSMVDVDEKGTDIVSKLLYMNLQSQQRGNWDDEENAWLQDIAGQLGGRISFNDYSGEGYQLMTADEVALVNKVWNATHDPIKTQEAFDALASTLRSRRMNFDEDTWAYRSDAYGSLMTDLASIGMQGYANIEGLGNAIQGLFGNQDVKDVTSDEWRTQSSVNAIRGYTGQQAYNSGGAWAKFAHDAGLAIGDEAMKFLPALAGGPLAQQAASAIAGMAQGTYGAYERGVDNPWLAAGEGAMNAAIEALTENVGLEAPSNSSMRAGKHWLQQIAAEAGEEGLSEILNKAGSEMLADATGTVSENDQAYMEAIKNSTEKDRTKRHMLAKQAVADQNIEDVLLSTALGGVVGGALSAPSSIGLNKQQRKTGKSVSTNSNTGALMEVAMSLDEGSEARQLAETLKAQADKGKKPSNGQLGRLYATIAKDLDAKSAAVVTQTMQDAIVDEMVDKGENEEVARRAAPILAKQLRGEKLTNSDTSALAESKTAITMMEELNKHTEGGKEDGPKAGLFKRTNKGTQVTNEQIQAVEDMLLERGDSAKAAKRAAPLLARVANGDTLTKSEQAFVDQTEGSEEIVSKLRSEKTGNKPLQRPAWVEDVETRQAVYAAPKEKDIATKGKALLDTTRPSNQTAIAKSADKAKALTVKDGAAKDGVRDTTAVPLGSKESVDIQRIEADNDGVLKLVTKDSTGKESKTSYKTLSFKGGSVGHVITHAVDNYAGNAEMANLMYQSYTGGDSTQYIAEMDAAYRAGFDASAVNKDSMTQYKSVAKHAFELGQKQAQEAEQTRLKNIGKAKLGKGRVTIPASVNETKLSKQQRNQVSIVRRIADATGINFTFFESQADATGMYKAENGSYDSGTNSIRLDLNAGKNFKGDIAEYAIVRTAAHEMTHFIEANSRENYAKMRQFIADELARKGLNFNSLVQAKIDRSPVPLTRGGAIAEVVADGCEMMLKDSEAIQRLMQKDSSLGQQIKNVLKEFVNRIRKAFEDIRPGSIEANALMDEVDGVLKYANELQKLWDAGLEESVEATRGDALTENGVIVESKTAYANPQLSVRTWNASGYVQERDTMAKELAAKTGVTVSKATKWLDDVNSIASMVLSDPLRLDYISSEFGSSFKSNPEYGGSVDMSTLCPKRRLATGTLDAIQDRLGDVALTRDDFLRLRAMMAERGHEVACGLCFVESSRANLSKYNKQFIDMYNATHTDQEPVTMGELNTIDGLESIRSERPDVYAEYEKFMNKLAQRKPKLFEKRTEYNGEILKKFRKDTSVDAKNRNGGLRLQSFSDFELVHLIDMMQVITDMANVGLAGQAYTKVPDFAWALGNTGLKINLSLIAKGVDENGKLIFNDIEGMNHVEAKKLRDAYSKNVGTILVTFTDEQLIAAMQDDFVDFIIPFHRSQWKKTDYRILGLPEGTKDYTLHQNEKLGRKRVKQNFMPNEYWKPNLSGKENAQVYLDMCNAEGRTPKFAKFLQKNADGTYSLKDDGSTDGYWKLLIDFKMYDNDGNGSKQLPVQPNFNMEQAARMLNEYKGGHETLPVAWDVVDDFVAEYQGKTGGTNVGVQDSGKRQYSLRSYSQHQIENWAKSKRIVLYTGKQSVVEFVNDTLARGNLGKKMLFGAIGEDLAKAIEAVAGVNVVGYNIALDSSEILKIRKSHGSPKTEEPRGQVAITAEDYANIVDVVTSPDNIRLSDQKYDGHIAIEFEKYMDGKQTIITYVVDDKHDLRVQTMYKGKKNRSLAPVRNASALLENTPMTSRGTAPDLSISDDAENSNPFSQKSLRTPEFNRWFGNSRVVDADGNPLVVYHGSSSYERFNVFKKGKAGYLGPGIYLTDQEWYAEGYTKRYGDSGQMYALYARIENPLRVVGLDPAKEIIEAAYGSRADSVYRRRQESNENETRWVTQADINKLKAMGYDGIIWGTEKSSTREYMVFSPEQIKSATDNAGTFDPQNPDIRYSLRTPAPATTRDYLLSLTDADLSTAGEKDAMMRYRVMVDELRELEEKRAAQQEIAATATGDDRIKAKNRADIYTVQIDRLNDRIRGKENTNVLRPIVAEAKAILEANRQLEIGRPVETVIKGMGGKVRDAETKLNRFREKVKQERDAREKITASRRRITKMVKYLDTLRRKESDYKHVPEELKPTVNALVSAFAEHSSMVFDSRRAERIAQAYSKLQALDNDLAAYYDPDVQARIEYIADLMELKRGRPMTLPEMEIIEDVVGAIYKMVRGSNEAFFENQMMDIAQIAADVADEMLQRKDKAYLVNSKYEDALDTLIRNGNLTPVYYFDNLNNAMLKRLGYDILGGQDKYGLYQRDDRVTMGEIRKQYNYNSWRNDKPIVHNDVQFTKEQALWVYATAKREATNELAQTHHLDEGGIVFEGGEVVGADGKKRNRTTPMRLSAKDVQAITDTLTEEQKGYADAVVQHLSTTVGERGNEVSMRMYGFRKYREQYYFPYKTASDQRHQTSVSNAVSATNDARLKHQSFSNPLKKGANTPLVIGDFTEMATSHMNAMNTYAAMVIPVENMNRVLNRKTEIDGAVTTLRGLMAQKYGDSTKRYLETLLKDLNGGVQVDRREGFTGALTSIYKGGAVVGSMSVVLQQWTSIFRAAYMINPKYFVSQSPFFKDEWEELTRYSGIASIKDMGRFDVGVGRSGAEWIGADADEFTAWQKARQMFNLRDRKTLTTRWDDFFNFLPGWADRVTWAQIWRAVKAEQAEQHPGMSTDSDAFLKMCAERFNNVINHTQVYDSVMTRSQLMRGKDAASKMLTAFASEPTLMLNMLYDAAHNPDNKGAKSRSMHVAGAMATVTLSQVFTSAMQALASAWRDDDDERKGLDKFLDKFGENVFDNLNPFSMFPMVRDIYTTLKGEYDVARGDMEFISEVARMIKKWEKGGMTPWQYVEEVGGTVAKIFRIPLKNIMRDLRAAYNAVDSDWAAPSTSTASHSFWRNRWGYDTSNAAYYQRLVDAINSGDKKLASDLQLYMAESMGKDEDAISTGARSYIKDLVQNGKLGLDEAVKMIDDHFPYDKGTTQAYKTVLGWLGETELEEGEEANSSAYRKLQEAMLAGNSVNYKAAKQEMMKYGYAEKTINSEMQSFVKNSYKDGEINWAQAEKMLKQFCGITDKDNLFWLKEEYDWKGDGQWGEYKPAREALLSGDKKTFLAEKSKLLSHGKEPKGVTSAIGDLKDELLALYETDITAARKLREMIVWAYMECGKTKDSANKIIDGWFKD